MNAPLIILIIAAVVGLGLYAWQADKKRREQLAAWAAGRGWRFRPGSVQGLERDFPGLKFFTKGHSRSGSNVITGELEGRSVRCLDYRYVTGHGKNRSTHKVGVVIIETGFPVIPLTIRRESPLDRVGEFFGADDIDFESAEFSRRFYVKSNDRKWAYDVIHQRTMDYLLTGPPYDIAFGFQEIAVTRKGHYGPAGYDEALAVAQRLYELIPDYVVQQMKGESR